ncbi:rabphilin-3A isoform X2 [Culicoides brevitarsis]|uniref:rabphilin-3A isoform X2 n=1 Tax=Culicoides brevitarsis TaxID=469753 RepID=UPI00307BE21C
MDRLKIGWFAGRPDVPLSSKEQETIKNVIRRNEALEMAERQRVGKLVERMENIKSRAVETGPRNCRMCGQTFGLLVGVSKFLCDICKKPVCSKCCIDLNTRSLTKRVVWLCKICSETRELWKKTGAWFYKGIPSYEVPQRKNINICKDANIDEEVMKNPQCSVSVDEDEVVIANKDKNSNLQNGTLNVCEDNKKKSNFIRQTSSNEQQKSSNNLDIDWDSFARHRGACNVISATNLKRSSVSSNFSISESFSGNDSVGGVYQVCRDPMLGWLEISIIYDESRHCLDCSILRARDLLPMDNQCLADPFCKANIITSDSKFKYTKWMKTKVVHKTINPEFNEKFSLIGVEPDELAESVLFIIVYDDDKYGHDFLGSCKFSLCSINMTHPIPSRMSISLSPEDLHGSQASDSESWPNGRIFVSLSYNTLKRSLVVIIKQCENLIPMDTNGLSDPFVKIQMKPESHRKKYKTSVKWRTLNPIYNEEFLFETRPIEMDKQSLYITVWDKDIGKSNDFLGSLIIGSNSKGRRLRQWRDCVRLPDVFHEAWHYLSNENIGHQR